MLLSNMSSWSAMLSPDLNVLGGDGFFSFAILSTSFRGKDFYFSIVKWCSPWNSVISFWILSSFCKLWLFSIVRRLGPCHYSFKLSTDFIFMKCFSWSVIPSLPWIRVPAGILPSGQICFKFRINCLFYFSIFQIRAILPTNLILCFNT